MSVGIGDDRWGNVIDRLRVVVRGRDDSRIRATYRVLLAMPIFWIFAGSVVAGNIQATIGIIPSGGEPLGGLAASLLHGGTVLMILVGWARYLDRYSLSEYGVSASSSWLRDLSLGMGAVLLSFVLWFGVTAALGWASVEVAVSAPERSVPVAIGLFIVALGIHVWVQQLVFFRIILKNAAEGLHSRDVAPRRAVVAAVLVAVPIFIAMHQLTITVRALDLAVAGLVYALVYVHTGSLAVGIGLHLGIFVTAQTLFVSASNVADSVSVFQVTTSMPESIAVLNTYGFPKMVVAYCLVVGYLLWRRGEIPVEKTIASYNR